MYAEAGGEENTHAVLAIPGNFIQTDASTSARRRSGAHKLRRHQLVSLTHNANNLQILVCSLKKHAEPFFFSLLHAFSSGPVPSSLGSRNGSPVLVRIYLISHVAAAFWVTEYFETPVKAERFPQVLFT